MFYPRLRFSHLPSLSSKLLSCPWRH
uniref:Uncharacterized protein n=1 Tax=Anguilla anguilla TaxID=7936 RepID=A0A0E9VRG9_ANGAN